MAGRSGLFRVLRVAAVAWVFFGASAAWAAPSCDADGDGFAKASRKCGGNDCNDSDAAVNPGAAEACNGLDDDCDGAVDEGCGGGGSAGLECVDGPYAGQSCGSDFDCGICVSGDNAGGPCASDAHCPPNGGPPSSRGRCEAHLCMVNLPVNLAAAGDSITQAFGASCTCNANFFCLFCPAGGDQPENSWFDGASSGVVSVHDRYLELDSSIGADKSASADGSEMRGGSNSFAAQANAILAQSPVPDHVEVELGGNDICNRDCVDPAHCSDPVYTDAEWTAAVRAGLDELVAGLPDGATVYLLGVPRVQDLRQAGIDKQNQSSSVDCEGFWADFGVCTIATQASSLNGETIDFRLAGITERQRRYNEILRDEAEAYRTNANGKNPRGIEVVADYVDEVTPSVGTFAFGASDINGGDCFHPSIAGQNALAESSWASNPDR